MSIGLDKMNYQRYLCLELGYEQMIYYYCPILYAIHDLPEEDIIVPKLLRLTAVSLTPKGIYLLDNGINMIIRFTKDANNELAKQLFGCGKIEAEDLISPEVILIFTIECIKSYGRKQRICDASIKHCG